jgi:hypothetical protein
MTAMGHEERFPPTRLSAGYVFRKETIAGVRHNGRDAPEAVVSVTAIGTGEFDPDAVLHSNHRMTQPVTPPRAPPAAAASAARGCPRRRQR